MALPIEFPLRPMLAKRVDALPAQSRDLPVAFVVSSDAHHVNELTRMQ